MKDMWDRNRGSQIHDLNVLNIVHQSWLRVHQTKTKVRMHKRVKAGLKLNLV